MRLLLSFLFISFFFLAPHCSEAAGMQEKEYETTSAYGFSKKDVVGYSEYGHLAITIFRTGNIRIATNQQRLLPAVHPNYSSFSVVLVGCSLPADRLEEPSSYCKPIGLKLLFPKHYFW
jgi:hypothetical protein